jgi:hypothetical protein
VFDSSLGTTNLLLGVMAAVSLLQAMVLVGAATAAWKLYHRTLEAVADARRQVEPLAARVGEIADRLDGVARDVRHVSSSVAAATTRAETVIDTAATIVGGGLDGIRASAAKRTLRLYGLARGLCAAYRTFVHPDTNGGTSRKHRSET